MNRVWVESEAQIANYVRGKVWEIVIVGVAAFVTFRLMGLEYALLLATMTGCVRPLFGRLQCRRVSGGARTGVIGLFDDNQNDKPETDAAWKN